MNCRSETLLIVSALICRKRVALGNVPMLDILDEHWTMEEMEGEPQRQRQPVTAKQKEQIIRLWRNSAYTNAQIAQQCRVKITTLYTILRTAPSISARRKSNPWRKSCRAERRKKIVDLFEKGCTMNDIMQEAQVNEKSINAALRRAGMSFKERDNPSLSQQQKAAILKLFEEGHMGTDIQEKVSVSKNALQKFLRETGKSFKKRDSAARTGIYETVSNEMMAQIAELQADGVRPAEIAKRLGVSRQSVIRVTAQSCGAPLCDRMLRSAQSQDGEDGRSGKPRYIQLPISDPHHSERGPYGHPGLAERKSISTAQDSRNTDERQNARRPRGRPRGTTSAVGYKVSGGRHKNKSANNGPSNAAVAVNVTSDVVEISSGQTAPRSPKADTDVHAEDSFSPLELFCGERNISKKEVLHRTQASAREQPQQQPEVTAETSANLPNCSVESTREAASPSCDAVGAPYQCRICRLSWKDADLFLSHLISKQHESFVKPESLLYCTACNFQSRQPLKMGQHIVKYQSQNSNRKSRMHAVKAQLNSM